MSKRAAESNPAGAPPEKKVKKPVRVFTDGCFDMMHYGHANALRQARALGDVLVVGVHSDAAILANKGPTVMKEQERYAAVAACKWVDEVVEDAPFAIDMKVLKKHDIDIVVHGDDLIVTADGDDCYAQAKAAGMFRTVPRTKGVSTTDLVGRMLLMTKTHHAEGDVRKDESAKLAESSDSKSPYTRLCKFIPTTSQIVQFAEGKEAKPEDKVGYIDGAWDLFHVGHISVLKEAKKHCDHLIVGVYDDETVNMRKGDNHPLANLHERVLGVLSCRYVDEVIIGSPFVLPKEMIKAQEIDIVFHGKEIEINSETEDPYHVPKELGIVKELQSGSNVTTTVIIERILDNRKRFLERNRKKEAKEVSAYEQMQKEQAAAAAEKTA